MAGNNTCRESGDVYGRGASRFSTVIRPAGWIKMRKMIKGEKGISLLETVIAVAIMGIIAVAFLSALATTSSARATNDERTAAKILAEGIIENIKGEDYSPTYEVVVPSEFAGYTVNVATAVERNGNIEKITVAVYHKGHEVLTLESYKVDRSSLISP
jgi:type II secretory pathway pseudopilin PulG